MSQVQLLTEIFPVHSHLRERPLYAYQPQITTNDPRQIPSIGGKAAYRLGVHLPGEWVWIPEEKYILADVRVEEEDLRAVLPALWQQEDLRFLGGVSPREAHRPSPIALARYAERLVNRMVSQILKQYRIQTFDRVRVQRWAQTRAWVVHEQPAVSITLVSRIYMEGTLADYLPRLRPLLGREHPAIWVLDRFGSLKGRLVQVLEGPLSHHRDRLLVYTEREAMKEYLQQASGYEPVVRVEVGQRSYEYPAGALALIPTFALTSLLGIDGKKLQRHLRMSPNERTRMLRSLAEQVRKEGLLDWAYRSGQAEVRRFFYLGEGWKREKKYRLKLRLRGNRVIPYDLSGTRNHHWIYKALKQHGLYQVHDRFAQGISPLRLGVMDLLPDISAEVKRRFLRRLRTELQGFGFQVEFKEEGSPPEQSLSKRVERLHREGVDLLLTFLPQKQPLADEEFDSLYHQVKRLTVGRGLPHQAITVQGLLNPHALANIVLGILGKTGNVPYVLATPLPYADLVVGLDIARRQKRHLPGTINVAAVARLYFHDGRLLRYTIHSSSIEGESVPPQVLRQLFDLEEIWGRRVVIHRDGYFRGREKETLRQIAQEAEATFYLVEVLKQGAPRVYRTVPRADGQKGIRVQAPKRGDVFYLNQWEALVVSSLAPSQEGTPQPLRVRTEPPFNIRDAVHSVLAMTLFHYGSLLPPRLPVTLHYSDRIAQMALEGIMPERPEGDLPYWL